MFQPKKDITPHPGKYEYKTFIGEGPKYTFRDNFDMDGLKKEKRHEKAHKIKTTPGPGHYNLPEEKKGPQYTISQLWRTKKRKLSTSPGVGNYELRKEIAIDNPSCKFNQEKRINGNLNHDALNNPGPGSYDLISNISTRGPSFSFCKAIRPVSARTPRTTTSSNRSRPLSPGPGHYNHKQYIGKEGISLTIYKEKYPHFETNNNPAPGQYIKSIKYSASTASYTFPKSQRRPLTSSHSMKQMINGEHQEFITPGPCNYTPNHMRSSTRRCFPSWQIGNEKRDNDKKDMKYFTPGPGEYTINNGLFPEGAKYSISERKRYKGKGMLLEIPGPGKYNTITVHLENSPSYSIGKALRDDDIKRIIKENFPGPAHYKVKDYKCQGITIPKSDLSKKKKKVTPGPGSYKIPCRFNDINNVTRERGYWNPTYKYV